MNFIVKNTTLPNLLDLIAPHYCRGCKAIGNPICDCCKNNIILNFSNYCPNCKTPNPTGKCTKCKSLPPTFVIGNRNELIGQLVHDLKYRSTRALSKPLADILNETLPSIDGKVDIVPLPTIHSHVRQRGLDHTYLIAKQLAKLRGPNYQVNPILTRAKNTVQVGADRAARLSQANLAYSINPNTSINSNTTYLLFDDVWTTGASMKAAIKKLRTIGAKKILVAVLAVSQINQK